MGLNIASWEAEVASNYNIDRNLLVDIVALLKARVPLLNDSLELYVTVPVGVSISAPSKDFSNYTQAEDGVGAAFGLRLGAGYEFYEGFGAYVEAGWAGKHYSHELKHAGWGGNKDATVAFHQFALNLGVGYTF